MPASPLARDFIKSAEILLQASNGKPRQADLRRSVSTTYYALFHALCNNCANCFVGKGPDYPKAAWRRAYRSLDHRYAKNACNQNSTKRLEVLEKFPNTIQDFAFQFYNAQIMRHSADYDPYYKITKSEVFTHIEAAKSAIKGFEDTSLIDRRAFATLVLFERD